MIFILRRKGLGKFLVKPIPKASSGLRELEYICFTDALLVPLHQLFAVEATG
jgi:hypothetical protein